jgi:hypothetical protein
MTRRPGFYKDQGKPISKIVSFNEVTQAVIAILLHRPDDSRARPGDYIGASEGKKAGEKHKLLFRPRKASKVMELSAYLKCVLIVKEVEDFLKQMSTLDYGDRRNLLFYVAHYVACIISDSPTPTFEGVFAIERKALTQELLQTAFKVVNGQFWARAARGEMASGIFSGTSAIKQPH